jgi:hypothetical protein
MSSTVFSPEGEVSGTAWVLSLIFVSIGLKIILYRLRPEAGLQCLRVGEKRKNARQKESVAN